MLNYNTRTVKPYRVIFERQCLYSFTYKDDSGKEMVARILYLSFPGSPSSRASLPSPQPVPCWSARHRY
jgi:hypothetical protein